MPKEQEGRRIDWMMVGTDFAILVPIEHDAEESSERPHYETRAQMRRVDYDEETIQSFLSSEYKRLVALGHRPLIVRVIDPVITFDLEKE